MRSCLTLVTMAAYVGMLFMLIPYGRVSMAFVLLSDLLSDHGKPIFPGFNSLVIWSYPLCIVLVLAVSAVLVVLQRDRRAALASIARIDAVAVVLGVMLIALSKALACMSASQH